MWELVAIAGCGAAVTVVSVVTSYIQGARRAEAEKRCGAALADNERLKGEKAILESDVLQQKSRGDSEKRRADALYEVLRNMPISDARQFVLSLAAGDNPAAGDSPGTVHPVPAPDAPKPDPDGLEKPE